MMDRLELKPERDDDRWLLCSPDAGVFTCALPRGAALAPGQPAGVLMRLGRAMTLVVPAGVQGVVTSPRPERVHAPVGSGEVLYELATIGSLDVAGDEQDAAATTGPGGNPVVVSPQAGRFYSSPSPTDPPFVVPGTEVHEGVAVGMIEVMKTFTQILYRAEGGLPARARVLRVLATDGADVDAGAPLVEVVPDASPSSGTNGD